MTDSKSRFETWYTKEYLGVNIGDAFEYLPSHGYKRLDVHFPWVGWQACETQSAARIVKLEAENERLRVAANRVFMCEGFRYLPQSIQLALSEALTNHTGE